MGRDWCGGIDITSCCMASKLESKSLNDAISFLSFVFV